MNNSVKRILTIVGIVIGLGALSVGAFFLLYQPEPEGVAIGISALPDSLNPVLRQNLTGLNANELVFDGLVNYQVDPESQAIYSEFALAEWIEQDTETKRIYTVGLKDVKWHDGRSLSADDVVFSFQAYMDPANDSPLRAYLGGFIASVNKVDDRTVTIEFHKPIPEFRVYPILNFKIIPHQYNGAALSTNLLSGDNERAFATKPVGTGPFKVDDWQIGKWVTFSGNPDYFAGAPKAETLVLRNIIDPVLRLNEFEKKNINLILETSPLDRSKVADIDGIQINSYLPYSYYQVNINTERDFFADPAVRQALAAGVDASVLMPGISDSAGQVTINHGPFPSDILERNFAAYNPAPLGNPHSTDRGTAAQTLGSSALAGQTLGLLYPDSMGEFGQILADALVSQYAALGVTLEARRTGDQVFRRLVHDEKDYDLALEYYDGFDNLFSGILEMYHSAGSRNHSGIADPELDQLLADWDATVEAQGWIDLARRIQTRMAELSPMIPLFSLQKDVYSRGITDLVIASDNPFLSAEHWAQEL